MTLARSPTQYQGVQAIDPPSIIKADRAPTTSDKSYPIGTLWIYSVGPAAYQLGSVVSNSANWISLGSSAIGDVESLTGDSGGAITPTAGNIDILGTANEIAVVGTASTLTLSLDDDVVVTTSVTTGSFITSGVNGVTYSANNIDATGSSANIPITVTPKGTGDFVVDNGDIQNTSGDIIASHSSAAADVTLEVTNSDNTSGTSRAGVEIATGGASSGDPYLSFQISGVGASTMTMGLDNSASDLFVISNSATIGTSNALTLSQAGALGATTTVTGGTGVIATTGDITATAGAVNAGTTMTATLGDITATNGNFVGSTAGTGFLFNANTATGAAASPIVLNSRAGAAVFTSVSIAAAADLTLTITNSAITGASTQVIYCLSGTTTGSALSIKSVTNSAGSSAVVVTNGTGATTSTADITLTFLVVN